MASADETRANTRDDHFVFLFALMIARYGPQKITRQDMQQMHGLFLSRHIDVENGTEVFSLNAGTPAGGMH